MFQVKGQAIIHAMRKTMFEMLKLKKNRSELVERASELKPIFSSAAEALDFYNKRLQELCQKYQMNAGDLFYLAERSMEKNPDFIEVLSIFRTTQSLKKIL